jgi:uncharacterized protein YndB with AHSA1/START domain
LYGRLKRGRIEFDIIFACMERRADGVCVRVEGALAAPSATIWRALRHPQEWWVREAVVEFRKGGRYEVLHPSGWVRGQVQSLWPGRRLVLSIPLRTPNVDVDTTLTVALRSENGKTRVSFEHLGPEVMAWMGELRNLESGWRETLLKLSNFVRGSR